jgi:anaerobic carbon-monoxide dehydrogenase iron sulfur subunit
MKKYLHVDESKCTGHYRCVSTCAKLYFKEDDANKSCIKVSRAGDDHYAINVCDQCQTCIAECPTQALTVNKLGVVMLNKSLCIGCYACVAICPIQAMRRYPGQVAPFKCIACGACAKECPEKALSVITVEDAT